MEMSLLEDKGDFVLLNVRHIIIIIKKLVKLVQTAERNLYEKIILHSVLKNVLMNLYKIEN